MKIMMKTVTLFLIATGVVYGRIGDTPTEFRKSINQEAIAQGSTSSHLTYALYKSSSVPSIYTLVLFYDGKSVEEAMCTDVIMSLRDEYEVVNLFFNEMTKTYSNGNPWVDCSVTAVDRCRQNGSVQVSYGMLGFVPSPAPKEGMWLSVIEGEYLASKIERELYLGELYSGAGMLPIKRVDPHSEKSIPKKTQPLRSRVKVVTITQSVSVGGDALPAGTRLEFVSKEGSDVHIRYQGQEYVIPISATNLK